MCETPEIVTSDAPRAGRYRRWRRRLQREHRPLPGGRVAPIEYLLAPADLIALAIGLARDPDVPANLRARLVLSFVYIASPIDLLPDALLGPLGLADDLAVAVWALGSVLEDAPKHLVDRQWPGTETVMERLRGLLRIAGRTARAPHPNP